MQSLGAVDESRLRDLAGDNGPASGSCVKLCTSAQMIITGRVRLHYGTAAERKVQIRAAWQSACTQGCTTDAVPGAAAGHHMQCVQPRSAATSGTPANSMDCTTPLPPPPGAQQAAVEQPQALLQDAKQLYMRSSRVCIGCVLHQR
jgi:hypothetical protein